MTFFEILEEQKNLNESLYDMDKIDEMYRIIYNRTRNNVMRYYVDFSEQFHKLFPEVSKSIRLLVMRDKEMGDYALGATGTLNLRDDNGARIPHILISMRDFPTDKGFKKLLEHEIIHALDYSKSYKEKRKFPKENNKKNYKLADIAYSKDPFELNQAVNMIRKYINKEYNSIASVDELMKYFFKVSSRSGREKITTHFMKDEDLRKKLVKRLSREGLLPKAMQ